MVRERNQSPRFAVATACSLIFFVRRFEPVALYAPPSALCRNPMSQPVDAAIPTTTQHSAAHLPCYLAQFHAWLFRTMKTSVAVIPIMSIEIYRFARFRINNWSLSKLQR